MWGSKKRGVCVMIWTATGASASLLLPKLPRSARTWRQEKALMKVW